MNAFLAPIDLLLITEDDFDRILRPTLLKKWNILRDALVHFNYFKLWDEQTVRECCIISKLKNYKPNEVIDCCIISNDLSCFRILKNIRST